MHSLTRSACVFALGALVILCAQPRLQGWGFEAHYFIVERALDLMPPPTKPFFDKHRAFIVSHTIDPDLWRQVGFDDQEGPRHFLHLDSFGAFPFQALPREYGAALQKYGPEHLAREGVLPWRVTEIYGRLVRGFEDANREGASRDSVRLFTSVLAHYVADGHVPLHTTVNHDGHLTNQNGLHARWESDLFVRYRDRLTVKPPAVVPVKDPGAAMFTILIDSQPLMDPLLAADRKAAAGRELYDAGYYDAYFAEMKPMLEKRLGDAIANVAAFVTGAWEAAGRPVLPLETKRTPRKVPRG